MTLVLNGEARENIHAQTIAELVAELGLPDRATLVEHNDTALRREEWPGRSLADGDRIEFVRIVAGG